MFVHYVVHRIVEEAGSSIQVPDWNESHKGDLENNNNAG
jgi:hypothetical protein